MKRLVFIILFISFSSNYSQNIQFGIKAGVNFSNLSDELGDGASGRTDFHIGGFYEDKISEKFAISPELLYSSMGINFEESGGGDGSLKLDYVTISINAKLFLEKNIILNVGPQFGYLVSSNLSSAGPNEDIGLAFKNFDYGLNIGLSYRFDNGLSFGIGYYYGLENISEDEGFDRIEGSNRNLQLSIGLLFK